jgi:hypothetical protein
MNKRMIQKVIFYDINKYNMMFAIYMIIVASIMISIAVMSNKKCSTLPKAVHLCNAFCIVVGVLILTLAISLITMSSKKSNSKVHKKYFVYLCIAVVVFGFMGMILNLIILSRKGAMITLCGSEVSKYVCDWSFVSLALCGLLVCGIQYTIHRKLQI